MSIKVLQARKRETEYFFQIHLDDSKVVEEEGKEVPDPYFVREYRWGKDIDLADIKREMKALVKAELARLDDGVPLSIEGKRL